MQSALTSENRERVQFFYFQIFFLCLLTCLTLPWHFFKNPVKLASCNLFATGVK